MPPVTDPNLLVGTSTGDDAAVYRLSDDLALVQTVDFFPPVVDDPYAYGSIAAANSMSDIYAMGGRPILALNIVAFPADQPKRALAEIMRGGSDKASEGGCIVAGGHTVDDSEPKYGMAVTGIVKPGCELTNARAQPGDVLVLTKPIGSGIITTGGKLEQAEESVIQGAIAHMATLNKAAAEGAIEAGVTACTDVTGFGLIGHLRGMLIASGVGARVRYGEVPLMPGAWELTAEDGIYPSGMTRNRDHHDEAVSWDTGLHPLAYRTLYDPQTSGGLLLAIPRSLVDRLMDALSKNGVTDASVIGELFEDSKGSVHVTP